MKKETALRSMCSVLVCAAFAVPFSVALTGIAFNRAEAQTQTATVPSPLITSISRKADDSTVFVVGKALANYLVTVDVISDERGQLFQAEAPVDPNGHWELSIPDTSFPIGEYTLRATTISPDGKSSAPRDVRGHKIKPQPVVNAGGVDLGWVDSFIIFVLAAIVCAVVFAWLHERSLRKREALRLATDRDMHGMCNTLCDEVKQLPAVVKSVPGIDQRSAHDLEDRVYKLQMTLEKMQGYLASEIRKSQ